MARYRGSVKGQRGEASRLAASGIVTNANGWNLGVQVAGMPKPDDRGHDRFEVRITGGSGASWSIPIAVVEENDDGNGKTVTVFGRDGKVLDRFPVRV